MAGNVSGTLVTFDFEGSWGMPYDILYNLHETTRTIRDILGRHDVNAMFFVVGRLIEEEPELISTIVKEGHAIGLHGYRYEKRLYDFSPADLSTLQVELKSVSALAEVCRSQCFSNAR